MGNLRRCLWASLVGLTLGCYAGVEGDEAGSGTEVGTLDSGTGDGGEDTNSTGDGDGDTGDGDGDTNSTGDGDTGTGDGDGDTGDGDTDTDTGDGDGDPVDGCTPEAQTIVQLVNAYRADNGKPAIPLSPSLCEVGQTHVIDLVENSPDQPAECNLHSWSDQGAWSPCCYTADHAEAACMWSKPSELTVYPGNGYENAAGGGGSITPEGAVDGWKNSPAHNDVMLNQGIWADYPWGAVGAGLLEGRAVLWFGVEADPAA